MSTLIYFLVAFILVWVGIFLGYKHRGKTSDTEKDALIERLQGEIRAFKALPSPEEWQRLTRELKARAALPDKLYILPSRGNEPDSEQLRQELALTRAHLSRIEPTELERRNELLTIACADKDFEIARLTRQVEQAKAQLQEYHGEVMQQLRHIAALPQTIDRLLRQKL
jgi:hypothetical protein